MRNDKLWIFLLISFGIAIPLFLLYSRSTSPLWIILLFLGGSYAPALAAWIMLQRAAPEERESFTASLMKRASGKWLAFAFAVPTLIWLTAFGISYLLNLSDRPAWWTLAYLPLVLLVNYGEEIGWRGYALPVLLKRRGPLMSALVLGVIWVLFHAPLYLQRPVFGILAGIIIMFISIILTWLYLNTGSIIPGMIFHAVFNTWTQVFAGGAGAELLLAAVILVLAVITLWLLSRSRRKMSVETVSLL